MHAHGRVALLLPAALLAACAVGPDYRQPPAVAIGRGWTQPDANRPDTDRPDAAAPTPDELSAWWRSLGDPTLDRLVRTALSTNLDLRQAQARILEARALRDAAAGGHAPTLDARGGVTRRRQSENGPQPIGSIPGIARDQTVHDAGFDTAWELDLFGGTRRAVEAASARVDAAQAQANDARISVAAEVARTYLTLRGAQRELAARHASVQTLQRTQDLVRLRAGAGDLAHADLDAVQARTEAAVASLSQVQARLRAAALGLGVLLGAPPERELALADTSAPPIALTPLPVGKRADLLRRRPDVRIAERNLAASTAEIGVATAELFPKLSIGASGGFQALRSGDLFAGGSQTWSIAPLISWRVFDGGRVRAQIRASQARQQQATVAYEKAVLAALGDAERALSDYQLGLQAVQRQQTAVAAARRSYGHSQARFEAGDIALTDLLTEERNLRDAEDAQARTQTDGAIALIALFKALGGGWDADADTSPGDTAAMPPADDAGA